MIIGKSISFEFDFIKHKAINTVVSLISSSTINEVWGKALNQIGRPVLDNTNIVITKL